MIRFVCPACQLALQAPDERTGARTVCPRCRQAVEVPAPGAATISQSEATAFKLSPAAATPGPAEAPAARAPWWKRILQEIAETGRVTWRQTLVVFAYLWNVLRRRKLRRNAVAAQVALGQELDRHEVGDRQLCEQIRTIDGMLLLDGSNKASARKLEAQRKELLLQLADPILALPASPPQVEPAWNRARAARCAFEGQQAYLQSVRSGLFPAGIGGWLRVGAGYGALVCFLWLTWLVLRPTSASPVLVASGSADEVAVVDVTAVGKSLVVTETPFLELDAGGHSSNIGRIALTPDGKYAVTASTDKTVRVWDIVTGETVRVFRLAIGPGLVGSIQGMAVSPDGQTVAAGGIDTGLSKPGAAILLLDMQTGKVLKTLKGHENAIGPLAFSSDGKKLASGGTGDRAVAVWDVATGKREHFFQEHKSPDVRFVSFTPDGSHVASCGGDYIGFIYSLASGKAVATLLLPRRQIRVLAWSPDSKTVATGHDDGTVGLWGLDGKLQRTFTGLREQINVLQFTPDGRELLLGGGGQLAVLDPQRMCSMVDIATGQEKSRFTLHSNVVLGGAISTDGKLALTMGGHDHETYAWRTADGSLVQKFVGKGRTPFGVGISADGRTIGWGCNNAIIWSENLAKLEYTFDISQLQFGGAPGANLHRHELRRRGNQMLGLSDQFDIVVVEVNELKKATRVLYVLRGAGDRGYCFTWLPDGKALLGTANRLHMWDFEAGKPLRTYNGHNGSVLSVALTPDGRRFVTSGSDQTIRIWDPEQTQPLLSLFLTEQDWIAWTNEGIYAASPNGERLLGWHINNGPEEAASFYPAAQFRRSLYHPDVIKHVVAAGSTEKAFALAGKKYDKNLNISQVLPPSVAITSPTGLGAIRMKQQQFEVKATARSVGEHPVTALRLLVNGRPYRGLAGMQKIARPQVGEVKLSWKVELPLGLHNLSVLAESAVSRTVSQPVEVTIAGGSADDRPNLYVLAVGINDYPGDLKLDFAVPDADAITQSLKEKSGPLYRKIEVKLIKDKQATRRAIEQGLAWLGSKMTHQDVGVVFFSGHGDKDDDGNFFLISVDVNPRNLAGSCVAGDYVKKRLGEMPGRIIAMLDACHSGAAGDRQRRIAITDDLVRDLITEDYGIIVMSSSLGREFSLESLEFKHGFFTLALMEGLAGKADFNRDGLVYLSELDAYAVRRVKELSKGQQTPVTAKPPTVRSFPLSSVDPAVR